MRALAEGGVTAVAIEPLAARVGATKGSAYWHFPNRDALLEATVLRWEQERTEAVIALVDAEPDPAVRLRLLFSTVLTGAEEYAVELALLAAADDPIVGPALLRVAERRIGYLTSLFAQLGFGKVHARRRAVFAYAAYLGYAQLGRAIPAVLPDSSAGRRAHIDEALDAMLSREEGGR